jgi:hypothetical protein
MGETYKEALARLEPGDAERAVAFVAWMNEHAEKTLAEWPSRTARVAQLILAVRADERARHILSGKAVYEAAHPGQTGFATPRA